MRKTQMSERSTFVDIMASGGLMSEYCKLKPSASLALGPDGNPNV